MSINIICLLLMGFIIKSKTEYTFEIIEELIPKRILFDNLEISPYKILKYSPLCEENINSKTENIYFQVYPFKNHNFFFYLYDNFSEIKQEKNGMFSQNKSLVGLIGKNFNYLNLTCKKDYYFIIHYHNGNVITTNELLTKYFEILVLKEEANINLSPLLSDHYKIYPRKKEDNLFFSFNCTMFAYLRGSYIIKENEIIIIDARIYSNYIDVYEFKKDKKYNITFLSEITIYFYAQSQFFKFDISKLPIIIYPEFTRIKKYILEIDITNYKLDEYILFKYEGDIFLNLKYQFKNELKNNNFIDLGTYGHSQINYIPIKNSKKDSSLFLYIRQIYGYDGPHIGLINISKFKVCEISSNFNKTFKGPKLFFIDYYKFNNLKSFGIESNHTYFFLEQSFTESYIGTSGSYENLTITYVENDDSYIYNRAFIIFNTTDNIYLKVNKFDYSIFKIGNIGRYFQICQKDANHKEFYFIIDNKEIFNPVFGNYDSFFISYSKIKTLSDYDFNKIKEANFFQSSDERGFLKIKCQNPAMVRHEYLIGVGPPRNLTSGKRYIIEKDFILRNKLYLDEKLINENISLKFSLLGNKAYSSIELILDNKIYTINSSQPLEIKYFFEKYNKGLMNFKFGENIENSLKIEINVGFIKEDLNSYKQIGFRDSFGKLEIESKKGIFIEIPKNLNENLYEYSIIIPYNHYDTFIYDVQISYDKIEFMVPKYECFSKHKYSYFRIIPLFNINPYITISKEDEESQNKLFYISIFNNMDKNMDIFIQKPKVLSEIKLNIINKLPPLDGEEQKYYYKIYFPKGDYNSLLVQDINQNYKSFSRDLNIYSLKNYYQNFLLVDKNGIMNNNSYLNYYNTNPSDSYLKFIPNNEFIYSEKVYNELIIRAKMNISQIEGKNRLKITINSFSYYLEQPFKYYLFINTPNDLVYINSIINKIKILGQNQIMMTLDDNGEKEKFEYDIEINDNLDEGKNTSLEIKAFFVPATKEGIIEYAGNYQYYYFKYIKYDNKSNTIAIVFGVLIIIVIIIIVLLYLRRRKKLNNDLNLKILDYINSIELK